LLALKSKGVSHAEENDPALCDAACGRHLLGGVVMPTPESTGKTVSRFTPAQLAERTLHRRAVEAVIWGMPAVNAQLMIDAVKKSGGDSTRSSTGRGR